MNEHDKTRWAMRLREWQEDSAPIAAVVGAIGNLFAMRAIFTVRNPRAFWSAVASESAVLAAALALTHVKIEARIRAAMPRQNAAVTDADFAPSGATMPQGAMPAPTTTTTATAWVSVRLAAIAPFTGHTAKELMDQLDERMRELAPVNAHEARLMQAVRALRRLAIITHEGGA